MGDVDRQKAADAIGSQMKVDMVNHPAHYKQGGIEVIDVLEAWSYLDFRLLNAIKYIARSPFKGNTKQDLEKAIWYIQRYIEKGIK